ncbi:MAG: extracellular solute-binding protein, partial [Candidatus Gallimonas sp.]
FLDYVNDQNTYNGRLYTLSIVDSTVVLFYNKTVLSEERIAVPDEIADAWTFDELKTTATGLTKTVGAKKRYGLQIAGDAGEWLSYAFTPLWTEGVVNSEGKVTTGYLNGDAGVSAGEYLRSLVKSGAVYASATSSDFSAKTPTASMALMGTQNISEFLALGEDMCDWGVTFYPADDEGKISAPCGGWTLGITKNCASGKTVAASEFLKYCTSKEASESCARDTASPPSRKSLYETMPEYSDPNNAMYSVYSVIKSQILTSAQLRPKTVGYEVFSTEMSNALKDILYSTGYDTQAQIRNRLTTAATKIDASIAQIKIY